MLHFSNVHRRKNDSSQKHQILSWSLSLQIGAQVSGLYLSSFVSALQADGNLCQLSGLALLCLFSLPSILLLHHVLLLGVFPFCLIMSVSLFVFPLGVVWLQDVRVVRLISTLTAYTWHVALDNNRREQKHKQYRRIKMHKRA